MANLLQVDVSATLVAILRDVSTKGVLRKLWDLITWTLLTWHVSFWQPFHLHVAIYIILSTNILITS